MFPDYSFHYYYEPHEPLKLYCKSFLLQVICWCRQIHITFRPSIFSKVGSSLPLLMLVVGFRYQLLIWLCFYIIYSYGCQQIHYSSDAVSNVCEADCSSSEEMPARTWGEYVHCYKKIVNKNIRLADNSDVLDWTSPGVHQIFMNLTKNELHELAFSAQYTQRRYTTIDYYICQT